MQPGRVPRSASLTEEVAMTAQSPQPQTRQHQTKPNSGACVLINCRGSLHLRQRAAGPPPARADKTNPPRRPARRSSRPGDLPTAPNHPLPTCSPHAQRQRNPIAVSSCLRETPEDTTPRRSIHNPAHYRTEEVRTRPGVQIGFKVVPKSDEIMGAWGPIGTRLLCLSVCFWTLGCSQTKERPAVVEIVAFPSGNVIAVAPALNFSGSSAFDPAVAGDLMASELSTLPGVGVIGVNRVMAILAEQGVGRIQSPRHALAVCERLGADAILVFAVNEFDPYTPVVGITAQLYTRRAEPVRCDATAGAQPGGPSSAPAEELPIRPAAECQRVFNATHERVQNAVRDYADKRKEGESPYGWRKYLASQQWFLRFCCHTVARDLLTQPVDWFGVAQATHE